VWLLYSKVLCDCALPACDGPCGAGHYCPDGSIRRRQFPCPAGRWGGEGSGSDRCGGLCEPGYFCPEASTTPTQHPCGGETVFCPLGSGAPTNVSDHHYATGGGVVTRHGQRPCRGEWTTPPEGAARVEKCPSTTAPLAGPRKWYDAVVDEREYKRCAAKRHERKIVYN